MHDLCELSTLIFVVGLRYGCFFFSSRRRHTRFDCDWSSDVCSSDLSGHWLVRQLRRAAGGRVSTALGPHEVPRAVDVPLVVTAPCGGNAMPESRHEVDRKSVV